MRDAVAMTTGKLGRQWHVHGNTGHHHAGHTGPLARDDIPGG